MLNKEWYRNKVLDIKAKEDISWAQICLEIGITYHTLLNILHDNYRGRLTLGYVTKKKIKVFIKKYEG